MVDNIDNLMAQAGFVEAGKTPEQPKEETKVETTTETKTDTQDTKVDAPKEEEKTDVHTNDDKPTETQKELDFNIESFNKAFGRNYKSKDEIQSLFADKEEFVSLKAKYEELEKQSVEKDSKLKEQFNPMSYFANEQQFKINQILKANPDLNESIINRIVTSNLDEMSELDVLKLNESLTTKGAYDDSLIEDVIKDRYGLDVDKEDLDEQGLKKLRVKEFSMKRDAEKALGEIKKMLDVEIPEFKDPTVLAQERDAESKKKFDESKAQWSIYTDKFVKELDKLSIEYQTDGKEKSTFDFAYDDDFKAVLKDKLPQIAAQTGRDVNNEQDVAYLTEQIHKDYLWINRSAVIKSAVEDVITKMTKEQFDKFHNTSQPKSTESPQTLTDEQKKNNETLHKMMDDFKVNKK